MLLTQTYMQPADESSSFRTTFSDQLFLYSVTDCDDCLLYKNEHFSFIYYNAEGFIRSPEFPDDYPADLWVLKQRCWWLYFIYFVAPHCCQVLRFTSFYNCLWASRVWKYRTVLVFSLHFPVVRTAFYDDNLNWSKTEDKCFIYQHQSCILCSAYMFKYECKVLRWTDQLPIHANRVIPLSPGTATSDRISVVLVRPCRFRRTWNYLLAFDRLNWGVWGNR